MTPAQYRTALARLGLTQAEAASFLGISTRSSNGYANGWPVPVAIAKLLQVIVKTGYWPDEPD